MFQVMTLKVLALLSEDRFRLSIGWVLEEMGHQVYYLNQIREDLLEEAIQIFEPDMFFDMGWDSHFKPYRIPILNNVLKKHHLYHVYFAEEDWLHFERWSKRYVVQTSPQFVLTRSEQCLPEYRGMEIPAVYLDVGCNLRFHRSVSSQMKYACDIAVVANAQLRWEIYRRQSIANLVFPLINQPVRMKIWGRGWDEVKMYIGQENLQPEVWQGTIPFAETPAVYNSAKINVAIQSIENQVSNRTYDILSSGGFLFTSDTEGVRDRLQPGVHCEISNSVKETLEKTDYYLSHESIRLRIARAGQERAERWFSYQNTLPAVWNQVEQDFLRYKGGKTL